MRAPTVVVVLALITSAVVAPRDTRAQGIGGYLATKIDSAALPLADRVTDDEGTTYLVEFERLVVSLRSGNRFRASVRFKRTIVSTDVRSQARQAPVQTLAVAGRYEVEGTAIRFLPDSSSDTRGLRMLAGTVDGPRRIRVPFDYRNGAVQRRRVLELHRRDDIL